MRELHRICLAGTAIFILLTFWSERGIAAEAMQKATFSSNSHPPAILSIRERGPIEFNLSQIDHIEEDGVISADDGEIADAFGYAVSISGDTALVTAPQNGSYPGSTYRGAAYIFVRDGDHWRQQQKLEGKGTPRAENFGSAVALDGDVAFIGATLRVNDNLKQGAVFVFVRNGERWNQQQVLVASGPEQNDGFGLAIALDGNSAVIGAPDKDIGSTSRQGAAYIFGKDGGMWGQQQMLVASEGGTNDGFGASVALDGGVAVVGAPYRYGGNDSKGAAYVYAINGDTWVEEQILVASDGFRDNFGSSVALEASTLVVGAPNAKVDGRNQGAAYVFTRSGSTWREQQKLAATGGMSNDHFGDSVALDSDNLLVGAPYLDYNDGLAYLFIRAGGKWRQDRKLAPGSGPIDNGFGSSVDIDGGSVIVGAPWPFDGTSQHPGTAFLFRLHRLSLSKQYSPAYITKGQTEPVLANITLTLPFGTEIIALTETIPSGLNIVTGSLNSTPAGAKVAPADPTRIIWGGTVSSTAPLTIQYQVTLAPNVEPGSVLGSEVVATTAAGDHYSAQAALAVEDSTFGGALMLIYIGADTAEDGFNVGHGDLSDDAIRLVNQAELKANAPGVRTIVMLDGPYEDDARIYNLKYDTDLSCPNLQNPYCANRQAPYIEGVNTFTYGDGTANRTSLAEFVISASLANPNAEMILLSLVGHGGGWSPELLKGQPTKHGGQPSKRGGQPDDAVAELSGGLLWDMHYADALTVADVANALQMVKGATGKSVDLLYLDACLMAMSEVANELRDGAGYLLASESWSWTSFPYGEHIADVGAVVAGNAVKKEKVEAIGRAWLENEVIALSEEDNYPFTFSLTDLGRMPALVAAQNNLAEALIAEFDGDALQTRERMDRAFATAECVDSNQSGRIEHDAVIGWADNYCDLGTFATDIAREFSGTENVVGAAEDLQRTLAAAVVANQFRSGIPHEYSELPWQWADLRGLTIYLPLRVDNWKRRYYNDIWLPSSKGSRWGAMLAKYWDNTSEPDAIDHPDPTCPEDGCQLPPPGLTAIDLDAVAVKGNNGIRIDWWVSSGVETVSDFTVQRVLLPLPGKPTTLTTMANPTPPPSQPYSYLDATAAGTYEYCYQVIAHGPGRERLALSNFTCAVAGADSIPLSPPPSLSVGEGSILVEWGTVQAAEAGGFRVYRSANRGVSMPRSDTLFAGTLYTDEAVWPGVEYCYRIHSIGPTGQLTAISQEACTSIGSAPFYTHLPLIGR